MSPPPYVWRHRLWDEAILASEYSTDARNPISGPAKATTATARKLACIVYNLLKYKEQYREPDPVTYQLKLEKTILAKLQKQAATLGYQLLPNALVPA